MKFMMFMILGSISSMVAWVFLVDHSWSSHAAPQESVATFYNYFGRLQDLQTFWERPAVSVMLEQCQIESDSVIFEFGYGTGSLAVNLLDKYPDAKYFGVDISKTMYDISVHRIKQKGYDKRADLQLATNSVGVLKAMPDRSISRFISTFVFDKIPKSSQKEIITALRTKLRHDGRICLTSLTNKAATPLAHYMLNGWNTVSRFCKMCLGGARPIDLRYGFDVQRTLYNVSFEEVIAEYGIPSQVVVARVKEPEPYSKRKPRKK